MGTRVGLLPTSAKSAEEMTWFELPGHAVLHVANAWEEGEKVHVYTCAYMDFSLDWRGSGKGRGGLGSGVGAVEGGLGGGRRGVGGVGGNSGEGKGEWRVGCGDGCLVTSTWGVVGGKWRAVSGSC